MNKKDNRRVRMTKQIIKDALIELMEDLPINKITVKDICSCADINRSTFYAHFSNQYALLEEIENDIINSTPRINLYIKEPIKPILENFFNFIYNNKDVYLVLFKNSNGNSFKRKILDKVFGKSDEKPEWITNMDLNDKIHFKMLMCAFGGTSLVEEWISGNIQSTPRELADKLSHFIES